MRIHSEEGHGTTVGIYLPRHQGGAERDEARTEGSLLPVAEAGETVRVVDMSPPCA